MAKEVVCVGGGIGEQVYGSVASCCFAGWSGRLVGLEALFSTTVVKSAYNNLTAAKVVYNEGFNHVLWLKAVTLKVNIFIRSFFFLESFSNK